MSSEECWDCGENYSRNEVFDIPLFSQGHTAKWCFNCAMKQLDWSDYKLIPKQRTNLKFKIQSQEDRHKLYSLYLDELCECYKLQFGELNGKDFQILVEISWDNTTHKSRKVSND